MLARITSPFAMTASIAGVLAGGSVQAGPLNPDFVPANAAWIGHINVESLIDSALGELLLEGGFGIADARERATAQLGFDPASEILGITAYALESNPEPTVVLVQTTSAIDEAIAGMSDPETRPSGYSVLESEGRTLHAYSKSGGSPDSFACVLTDGRDRIVVIADAPARIHAAAGLVEGHGQSISDADDAGLNLRGYKNAIVFLEAGAIESIDGWMPASQVLRAASGVSLRVIEEDDDTSLFSLTLATPDEEEARNLSDVLTGMVGMARMIATQRDGMQPMADLLRSIAVRPDRSALTVDVRLQREMIETIIAATQPPTRKEGEADSYGASVDHP